jgi:transcriptional adapter 3
MTPILSQYGSPPPIRSALFKNPPDAVPPTDDLKTLHEELKMLKQKTLERAKKAGEDLRTIEESMKRMKEREKGKGKAVEKTTNERECGLF